MASATTTAPSPLSQSVAASDIPSQSQPQSTPAPAPTTTNTHRPTPASQGPVASTHDNTAQNASINSPPVNAAEANAERKNSQAGAGSAQGAGAGAKEGTEAKEGEAPVLTPDDEISEEQAQKAGLPEQKHAGKVGYGPEYANQTRATMGDKIEGLKEQVMGKLKKNPDLAQHGRELRSGELKRREHEERENDTLGKDASQDHKKTPTPANEEKPSTTSEGSAPASAPAPKASADAPKSTTATDTPNSTSEVSTAHLGSTPAPTAGSTPAPTGSAITRAGTNPTHSLNSTTNPAAQNTPAPYAAAPTQGSGLNGGKSDDVDLNPGAARLTKGHHAEGEGYKRDGKVVGGEEADQELVRAAEN
ncbi:hypothetical protein M422DRAFT_39216 [Sphaerobolus stellatus SS14]|uniref:Unplaced genomic scaffold SPHSTscaffold_426, whole genome shotgun sequence n=1 Tax=Sphaerobolus stellatus (strain SS14) TaxID=990650 RepID=A0A0C9UFU8_SPHS4|nr:hypothetical protein M422DRAFT_39216 [Sphaerobolus stellatus SS14]